MEMIGLKKLELKKCMKFVGVQTVLICSFSTRNKP